jgi:RNA polymerase sigma factor (sigma-70 family)
LKKTPRLYVQLKVYSKEGPDKIVHLELQGNGNISVGKQALGSNHHVESELYALVRECLAESRSAQKRLYDIYAPRAFGIIRRYIYDDEPAAEEVLNDSFFKVLTKLDQYSFQGSFEGWIRRIVINTITDHLRKTIGEVNTKEVQPDDAFVNSEPIGNIAHKELLELIHSLPNVQRTVFNLFVVENYAHKEIGELIGISEPNSRWYLNDARKRLKEKISFISK